jgi:hypothetical protein
MDVAPPVLDAVAEMAERRFRADAHLPAQCPVRQTDHHARDLEGLRAVMSLDVERDRGRRRGN